MQTLYGKFGKYFDVIADASSVDTEKEVAFLASIFSKHKVRSVLDIACGTGRHSVALAKEGYGVVGVDYAEELLKVARSKSKLPNLVFRQQDVMDIALDQKFDAAICMWSTFGELPYKEMLRGLKNVLNPSGIFIVDVTRYLSVPTGTAHKTYTNNTNDVSVYTEIDERYDGIRRIREITNTVNGETVTDHSEMDSLTEADLVKLLADHGFQHNETYYDYSLDKKEDVTRIQLVFDRS